MIPKNGATEKVSKIAIKEFMKRNKLTNEDMAEASGYSNGSTFCRAKNNGYMNPEAVFNLCRFFDLPRDYFEGAHEATGDEVILKDRKKPEPCVLPIEKDEYTPFKAVLYKNELAVTLVFTEEEMGKLKQLAKATGFGKDPEAYLKSLFYDALDKHQIRIAERYKDLSRDELIQKLVERDLAGESDV